MIAGGLIDAGAKVYITSRKREICEAAAGELGQTGECVALCAELNTPEAVAALAADLRGREREVHILINNAGRTWGAPWNPFPTRRGRESWQSMCRVPLRWCVSSCPFSLQARAARIRRGSSIRIARRRARRPLSAYSYAASKAAIHHLSRLLAKDLAPRHITVNSIIPGYFPTQMTAHIRGQDAELSKLLERVPLAASGNRTTSSAHACSCARARAGM